MLQLESFATSLPYMHKRSERVTSDIYGGVRLPRLLVEHAWLKAPMQTYHQDTNEARCLSAVMQVVRNFVAMPSHYHCPSIEFLSLCVALRPTGRGGLRPAISSRRITSIASHAALTIGFVLIVLKMKRGMHDRLPSGLERGRWRGVRRSIWQ